MKHLIKNYTTEVPVEKTIAAIQAMKEQQFQLLSGRN